MSAGVAVSVAKTSLGDGEMYDAKRVTVLGTVVGETKHPSYPFSNDSPAVMGHIGT